jgi:hypothetical protein
MSSLLPDPYELLAAHESPPAAGATTVALLPDTQFYADDPERAEVWLCMMDWLLARRDERNLRLVLHVGDVVNRNLVPQWELARKALGRLHGKLPLVLSTGNHDLGRTEVGNDRHTYLNDYFSFADLLGPGLELLEAYAPGEIQNALYRFDLAGKPVLVLALEFGPRAPVVAWADALLARHPGWPIWLVTHEFIDHASSLDQANGYSQRSTRVSENSPHVYGLAREPGGVLCGSELWDALLSRHPGFEFVFNGHYKQVHRLPEGELARLDDIASAYRRDGRVQQMMFNAQWAPLGGNGWMRLLEVHPDGETVTVKTVSPWRERHGLPAWRLGPRHAFSLRRSG